MPNVAELMTQILKILEEERELNRNDALVCSLINRIENKIAVAEFRIRSAIRIRTEEEENREKVKGQPEQK